MKPRSLRYRAPVLWLLLPMAVGLVAGRLGADGPAGWVGGLGLGAGGVAIWRAWRGGGGILWMGSLGLALVCAGDLSYQVHREWLAQRERLPAREAKLDLLCEQAGAITKLGGQMMVGRVEGTDLHLREMSGQRVAVMLDKGQVLARRGLRVRVRGLLSPVPFDGTEAGGAFLDSLVDRGVGWQLRHGQIERVLAEPRGYAALCEQLLVRWRQLLSYGLPERLAPLSHIYEAMLLGLQSELSAEQVERYRLSGTMHLFSISGLHIGIMALALEFLLSLLRVRGWWGLVVGMSLLWLFVDVTGASASAIRSYGMVLLLKLAYLWRRQVNPVSTLATVALFVCVVSPMDWFGAGFQMSYGIVASLLLLGLPMTEAVLEGWNPLKGIPSILWTRTARCFEAVRRWLVPSLCLGVSTSCTGILAGMLYFQTCTQGALVANLVMIPVSSLVVLGGFCALVCGSLGFSWGASLFNHAALLVLWGMDQFLKGFLKLPGTYGAARFPLPWLGKFALGMLLVGCIFGYDRGWGTRRWGLWIPPALSLLLIVLCWRAGG